MTRTVLLLAGTAEARELASQWAVPDTHLVASLAGVTQTPVGYACEIRTGGFGGGGGLAEWLNTHRAAGVIDATHPFAEQITRNAVEATTRTKRPYLRLRRPPWEAQGDWREVPSLADAAAALPKGARAFLTTGRGDIAPFAARTDVAFTLRSIEPLDGLPPHIEPVLGRPPFLQDEEEAFLRARSITHLVTKNAGGARPAKLAAANVLGIPILSIAMPSAPKGSVVETVEAALDWAAAL